MSLTSEQRQAIRVTQEGSALQNAQCGNLEHAADVARCVIDGWVSALIRLEGPEKASEFIFALQDRVVRGIRGATMIPEALKKFQPAGESVLALAPAPGAPQAPAPQTPPHSRSWPWWAFIALDCACAVVPGLIFLAFAIQHAHWSE